MYNFHGEIQTPEPQDLFSNITPLGEPALIEKLKKRVLEEGTPLIDGESVTFVWLGKRAPRLAADFTDWERGKPVSLLEVEPGVWVFRKTLPLDAYVEYAFFEGERRLPDPHNQRVTPNGIGDTNHYFYMPVSSPSALSQRQPGVKRGKLSRRVVDSSHLTASSKRNIVLYSPPTSEPTPLVVVWDGTDFHRRAALPTILDNLIAQKRIRPISLAMVQNGGPARMVEYGCSEITLAFLKWTVLPLAVEHLNLIDCREQPGAWGVMGASMGGLMALFTGLRLPDQFGSVLSLSGAFSSDVYVPLIFDLVTISKKKPSQIYINVGLFDFQALITGNRRMPRSARVAALQPGISRVSRRAQLPIMARRVMAGARGALSLPTKRTRMSSSRWTAFLFAVLLPLSLISCSTQPEAQPVAPISGSPSGTGEYPWWNDAVFYEVFIRSYYDSDGDGIGDFNEIIAKLDTLNDGDPKTLTDLGVHGLWLMPIHPASSYHGYDVTDYYDVNPEYGKMEDFQRLLEESHKRGMKVVIDLVINHSSNAHPWFQAAQVPASEYRDWYVWSDTEPTGSGWHPSSTGFYLGIFDETMPDLNYTNPVVSEEMKSIVRYWSQEIGVDGFRLDAAKHLIEDGSIQSHSDATHQWYKAFRKFYKDLDPDGILVGEVWDSSVAVSEYVSVDELDLAFDFDLAQAILTSARIGNAGETNRILQRDLGLFSSGQFAPFLTNHDQARVMSNLADNPNKAKVAASVLLSLPGVPFIYYGEELGMLGLKPDELIRTPYQWSGEAAGGFSTGQPWQPLNQDSIQKNFSNQNQDDQSLLQHYRLLVNARNQHAALRIGETFLVQSDNPGLFASLRHSPEPLESILVLVNLSEEPVSAYTLSLQEGPLNGNYHLAPVLTAPNPPDEKTGLLPLATNEGGGFSHFQPIAEIPPLTTLFFQLQPKTVD